MNTPELLVSDHANHRVIELNRPERRNALTVELVDAVIDAVRGAERTGARAIILTGAGASFCSGGDLPSLLALAQEGSMIASDAIYTSFHGLVRALRDSPLLAIAAVNGHALGAGLDLALACDLRYAAPKAVFESSWIKAGLVPGMAGAHRLQSIVGAGRAAEMLLLGRRIDASTALAWGLANDVAEDGDVLALAESAAESVAGLSKIALARTKAAFRRKLDNGLDNELATLGAQQGQLLASAEFVEATAALVRGR